MKKLLLVVTLSLVVFETFAVFNSMAKPPTVEFSESKIARRWQQDGNTYVVVDGGYYQDHGEDRYSFIQKYYDVDVYEKYYTNEGEAIYVGSPDDLATRVRTRNEFRNDFESYKTVRDLIVTSNNMAGKDVVTDGIKTYDPDTLPTRWTSMALQSPRFPKVKDYVTLRNQVLEDGRDFVDNRVEPSDERAHSGRRSVRFYSVARSRSMVTCKSSMSTETLHFRKGDHFWFSGWFYFEKGMPTTIMDLESTWLDKHSGIRILFSQNGNPTVELKAFEKPKWRNRDVEVARNQWVQVKVHFLLDEKDGEIELWLDDQLVIDDTGQTLPLADTVLNSLEVGISATSEETTLFMDDLKVSKSTL